MLLRLTQGLQRHTISSTVVNLCEYTPVVDQFRASGIPVHCLNLSPNPLQAARGVRAVRKLIESLQPEVVQGWMYHANIIVTAASWLSKYKPTLLWNIRRGLDDYKERGLITRGVVRGNAVASRSVSRIIYCSHESRMQHEQFGFFRERSYVLENGFDTSRFSPSRDLREAARARLGIAKDQVLVGNVARFDVAKGHGYLLDAFAKVVKAAPNARLVLIGRGVLRSNSRLMKQVARLGLTRYVQLLGEQEGLEGIYPAFDIYCSSSLNEGFPNAISEAMACGVPCVVTDTGASRQLVDGIGEVVPPRRSAELASSMSRLVLASSHERARRGDESRQRIVQLYSLDRAVNRYAELYSAS